MNNTSAQQNTHIMNFMYSVFVLYIFITSLMTIKFNFNVFTYATI